MQGYMHAILLQVWDNLYSPDDVNCRICGSDLPDSTKLSGSRGNAWLLNKCGLQYHTMTLPISLWVVMAHGIGEASHQFGAVFIISHDTGKVLDNTVKSKHCAGCSHWLSRNHDSEEYHKWKETHKCDINFIGSAYAMKPYGTLEMFCRSSDYKIHYMNLISDGDSKTHGII